MKIEVRSKKGLRTILSVIVDKETIQNKMDERLSELQKEKFLRQLLKVNLESPYMEK
jgi:hypothetical protein